MPTPENGDLVEALNPKLPVPDDVQEAIRTLIPLGGRRPEP
jgi:hypothetical protein